MVVVLQASISRARAAFSLHELLQLLTAHWGLASRIRLVHRPPQRATPQRWQSVASAQRARQDQLCVQR